MNDLTTNQKAACPLPARLGEANVAAPLGSSDRIFLFGQDFLLRVLSIDPTLGQAAITTLIVMASHGWDHILSAVGAK